MAKNNSPDWLDKTLKYSEDVFGIIESADLDDTFGWGGRLSYLAEQEIGQRPSGVFLCGPEGCGKHTAASRIVLTMSSMGYRPIFPEFPFDPGGGRNVTDSVACIDALLDKAYDDGVGTCLVLDLDRSPCRNKELFDYLGITSFKYDANRDVMPGLFLVIISCKEIELGSLLSCRLMKCRMPLPDAERRHEFLKKRGAGIRHYLSLDNLSENTEGFSYSGLIDLVTMLTLAIDQNGKSLSNDDVNVFIESQRSLNGENAINKIYGVLEKSLTSIEKRLAELGNSLSNGRVITGSGAQSIPGSIPTAASESKNIEGESERIRMMPVRQLAVELMGEKSVEQLMNA